MAPAIGFSSLADGAMFQDRVSTPVPLTVVSERQASEASGLPARLTEYIQRDRRREAMDSGL